MKSETRWFCFMKIPDKNERKEGQKKDKDDKML